MIHFIGAASGWGAQKHATEKGAAFFMNADVVGHLKQMGFNALWDTLVSAQKSYVAQTPTADQKRFYVKDHLERLCSKVQHVIRHGHFPVVIGGDHACAMGTWSGVISALGAEGNFGLIWVDAHMDAHTEETSPSKAIHGMPLSHLLGVGSEDFIQLGSSKTKLNPQYLCLIGIRSFESQEEKLLRQLGVRIFYMDEVNKRGFRAVFEDALKIVSQANGGFGLSIDLDGFDPQEAPATGSLEKNGLFKADVLPALAHLPKHKKFKALEIAEFNPTLRGAEKTLKLMEDILSVSLKKGDNK